MPKRSIYLAALLVLATLSGCEAPAVGPNGELGDVYRVEQGNPAMERAYVRAREGRDRFLETWRSPPPDSSGFAVKVGVSEGEDTEYFWITPFREEAGRFIGTVSNEPTMVRLVSLGSEISFSKAEIVDWMYFQGEAVVGNHTACAMLENSPVAERTELKRQYGLQCDGLW
ncbi:YegJ family protein [Arenimonas sp.]|uniref:YegJ family protein n=1 Tax=Arenimonas sp. TaxID=1872635 RepID=UPI002E31771C|nr:DUF2314 domain-containing protein [Arenimonas sp.]HEX4854725.1 DUF2314 domain-containing protein [Arenimonas sp.]